MGDLIVTDKRYLQHEAFRVVAIYFEIILLIVTIITSTRVSPGAATVATVNNTGIVGLIGFLAVFSFSFSGLIDMTDESEKERVIPKGRLGRGRRVSMIMLAVAMVFSFCCIALLSTGVVNDVTTIIWLLMSNGGLLAFKVVYESLSFWALLRMHDGETTGRSRNRIVDYINPMLKRMGGR